MTKKRKWEHKLSGTAEVIVHQLTRKYQASEEIEILVRRKQ